MSQTPFFSIVIPAYNRAAIIGNAIRSCLDQTFRDFEIVVVDDGSDDPAALEAALQPFDQAPIRLIRQINAGAAAARNTGIDHASGRYVAFLDTDDEFLPSKLETFAAHIGSREKYAGFAPALVDRGMASRIVRPRELHQSANSLGEYFYCRNQMVQSSMLVVDRQTARNVRFSTDMRVGEDLDFCLAIEAAGVRWEMLADPQSIWFDAPRDGRSSDYRGSLSEEYQSYRTWRLLSPKARKAYEGTVGAFHTAPHKPLRAAKMLAVGVVKGGVPPKVAARQFLRCYLPRKLYHTLVASAFRNKALGRFQSVDR